MEKELRELLLEFPDLELNEKTKRIRCKSSGHEMPCTVKAVSSYVYGKKYKGLKTKTGLDVESLSPLIVPSALEKQKLFCCLTGKYINNTFSQVDTHTKGTKYQTAKSQFDAGLRELIKEIKEKPTKKEDKTKRRDKERRKDREDDKEGEESDMEITPVDNEFKEKVITKSSAVVKHKLPPKKTKPAKKKPLVVSKEKSGIPMEQEEDTSIVMMNKEEERKEDVKLKSILKKRKTDHKIMSRRKRLLLEKSRKSI